MPTTPREHLDWAVDRALEYYDLGERMNAMMSFASDVGKHEGTAWIRTNHMLLPILEDGYDRGRQAFKDAMTGFAVGD